MNVLITGSSGMLGYDLVDVIGDEHNIITTTSNTLDITDKEKVLRLLRKYKPDVVINAAAYTDVDGCEIHNDVAFAVNSEGVENLAIGCKEIDAPLVHISTDYVFDGSKNEPLVEDDMIGPISTYGKSKLAGEVVIEEMLDKFFIVRTSWLYGINGESFPRTMLELAQDYDKITVVYDEIGSPTFTLDLAKAIAELIKTDYYGIYHVTNSGSCSWCEFAREIFDAAEMDIEVIPVTASEFARPAPRPSYSVLSNEKWIKKGFKPLRNYKEALLDFIGEIFE